MLVFNAVDHSHGHHRVFQDLSLRISESRVHFVGPNGSGKTTFLLIAAGLITPLKGTVTFNEQPVLQTNTKKSIGISASKVALPAFMTVKELLSFHALQFGCNGGSSLATRFGLEDYYLTQVSNLSLGNYKKLSLVTALMHQPQLLLLDEPSNGLDAHARRVLDEVLINYPGQIIIASHDNFATNETRVLQLPQQTVSHGAV